MTGSRTRYSFRPIVLGAVLLAAVQPRIGSAAVDMTGDWRVAYSDYGPVSVAHFTQSGTSLQITVPGAPMNGSGTIDPNTGIFTFTILFPIPDCGGVFSGRVDATGNSFIAPGNKAVFVDPDCHGGITTGCPPCRTSQPGELRGSRDPCGDGTIDASEQCDDGDLGRHDDCCALGCILQPVGAACASDGNGCTSDVCDALGTCTHLGQPEGSSCADGLFCNGQETTCVGGVCQTGTVPCPLLCDEVNDTCVTGCPSDPQICREAQKSLFLAKSVGSANAKLVWKWLRGAATSQPEFGDPTANTDYALCIYIASSALLGQVLIPAGTNWSAVGASGYKYNDPAASGPAIDIVRLQGGADNKSKVLIKNRGGTFPGLSSFVPSPLTVQLFNGTTGVCWGATYTSSQLLKNAGGLIKAKAP
jgi:hypothetical protein